MSGETGGKEDPRVALVEVEPLEFDVSPPESEKGARPC